MKDQTILLTGASRGIGRELVELLIGQNTVIAVVRNPDHLDHLRQYPNLVPMQCDLADPNQLRTLVNEVREQWPGLSVIINNAAIQQTFDFTAPSSGNTLLECQINFIAPLTLINGLLPVLLHQPSGTIINITSVLALSPKQSTPLYNASKAALRNLCQSLRFQLRDTPVRIVEVIPPETATRLGGKLKTGPAPRSVAQKIVDGIDRGQTEIAIGKAKAAIILYRIFPRMLARLLLPG